MKQDIEATSRRDDETRERVELYSLKLGQQTTRTAEMRAQISELEAQLSCYAAAIQKVRGQSPELSSASAVPEPASVDPNGGARITALPQEVPVGKTVGFTQVTWDTGDGSDGEVYVSVDS